MLFEEIIKRKIARMELKTEFAKALYSYLDDPSYAVATDSDADYYSAATRNMMEGHEKLMNAGGKYRAAFYAFKEASDRGDAKIREIESQIPDAEKQRQPFRASMAAIATFALKNAATVISAHRNLNRMFDIYEKASSISKGPSMS